MKFLIFKGTMGPMKLAQLLSIYSELKWGESSHHDVVSLTADSRLVEKGSVFVAIRGVTVDSHHYIKGACEKGAIALIVEDTDFVPDLYKGAVVEVSNGRAALDQLASRFYGDPAEKIFCVGVTGTNGKTSIVYMVEEILKKFGWRVGVMGTVDHHLGDRHWKSALTTPDPVTLQKRLGEFLALRAQAVVFEVSSHALDQHRVDHIPFDTVVFSNLTRDHLDYHKDLDHYFRAKERLFAELPLSYQDRKTTAVINRDDPYGLKLGVAGGVRLWFYGEGGGEFQFKIVSEDFTGCRVELKTPRGEGEFHMPLPGRHNAYNAVAALAVGMSAGASLQVCCEALSSFRGVPGRLERVENSLGLFVFVDYAHTDDALRSVLSSLNQIRKRKGGDEKLITIFGCGGDRDRGKRPLMAKAAVEGSDTVFITTDNPRNEDPVSIINESLAAIPKELVDHSLFVEQDRKRAFSRAFEMAEPGDIVLIAGKGHESYQVIGSESFEFNDVAVAKDLLK
ncbi:UDP-N-acetylmuramoyl-L-alanyl-D-glutamate--2,6-diaminopimelate ligase [Bdellovibrionales bacterium]|nr:UDP-N-acetylmuramoyl-L-alanyl-D-glutamate--2,6-diaminopimelate ligase [Bdellovibrionales bacterium]